LELKWFFFSKLFLKKSITNSPLKWFILELKKYKMDYFKKKNKFFLKRIHNKLTLYLTNKLSNLFDLMFVILKLRKMNSLFHKGKAKWCCKFFQRCWRTFSLVNNNIYKVFVKKKLYIYKVFFGDTNHKYI
jgi:hypothetical protein